MMHLFRLIITAALAVSASAFHSSCTSQRARTSALSMQTVIDPLPKLYVYDHCPFCVRVRLAFGLKGLKHDIVFLANDDIPTPTALVGKKIAPIFADQGFAMAESMDIISKVDADERYGTPSMLKPLSGRTDLQEWQKKVKPANSLMQRARYMMVPLPEFHTKDGRNAFVKNHPIPPYDKPAWKELDQNAQWLKYSEAFDDSLKLIDQTNDSLEELDKLIYSTEYCTEGGLSYDDIDLWARLRSLTLIKGLKWPKKLRGYMDTLAEKGDCPLYDAMAC